MSIICPSRCTEHLCPERGITQEAQQTAVTGAAGVVYAYNADKTKFLYLTFAEGTDAETAVFDSTLFGIAAFPEW